jgi:hypothetical protein
MWALSQQNPENQGAQNRRQPLGLAPRGHWRQWPLALATARLKTHHTTVIFIRFHGFFWATMLTKEQVPETMW